MEARRRSALATSRCWSSLSWAPRLDLARDRACMAITDLNGGAIMYVPVQYKLNVIKLINCLQITEPGS